MKREAAEALAGFKARMGDAAWAACQDLLEFMEAETQGGLAAKPREEAVFVRERVRAYRDLRKLMEGKGTERQGNIYAP